MRCVTAHKDQRGTYSERARVGWGASLPTSEAHADACHADPSVDVAGWRGGPSSGLHARLDSDRWWERRAAAGGWRGDRPTPPRGRWSSRPMGGRRKEGSVRDTAWIDYPWERPPRMSTYDLA